MTRYNWNIVGLCESRLPKAGVKSKQDGHRLYWSGLEDTHEQGVGFIVHKNTVNCVMTCCPISSRLITIRLRASPFNITIIQAYASTTNYSDDDAEYFYEELQKVLDKTPKKTSLWCKGTETLRLEKRHVRTGEKHVGITATQNQTIEAHGYLNSLATMTWWWQTHLAPTKHQEKSPGTAQTKRHTTELTTSW